MSEPREDGRDTPGPLARELRAPKAAGVAGLVFSVLFVSALLLVRNQPGPGASGAEIEEWYLRGAARHLALVGLYLAPFAGIAFLWFMAALRDRVGEREDKFFATVFLGSGLLFVAMIFAAAAAGSSLLNSIKFQSAPLPGADTVGLVRALSYTFLYVYAVRAAAVFMLVVSTIGWRTRTLPRWLVIAGYVIAVTLLVAVSFYRLVVLVVPAWVAAVSIVLLAAHVPRGFADDRGES